MRRTASRSTSSPGVSAPALNDYRSGATSLNAAATIVHEGDHINRGIPTRALFGTLDYYGTVLTADPDIKTLKDLEGKTLGAATVSGNYAIFRWFAKRAGVDLAKAKVLSLGVPALLTTLVAGRVDALQCWEPGASIAQHKQPGKYHRIDYAYKWKDYTGFDILPYLTVAAKADWVKANEKHIPKLYATYKDASDFLYADQKEWVAMMVKAAKGKIPAEVLQQVVEKDTLQFHPHRFKDIRKEAEAVFKAHGRGRPPEDKCRPPSFSQPGVDAASARSRDPGTTGGGATQPTTKRTSRFVNLFVRHNTRHHGSSTLS